MMRRLALWLILRVRLGRLAPFVLGLALGSRPGRVKEGTRDD